MKKVTPIKKDEVKAAFEKLVRDMPVTIKHIALMAQLRKAAYDACLKEGFTPEQALELSKSPLGMS